HSVPNIIFKNNIFDCQGFTVDSTHDLSVIPTTLTEVSTGYVDGLILKNCLPTSGSESSIALQWAVQDINELISSISLDIRSGLTRDFTISNSYINGWLNLELNNFPITNGGEPNTYNTAYLNNVHINVPSTAYLA